MSDAIAKPSGLVVPHSLKWHGRLAAAAIYGLTRCVAASLRYKSESDSGTGGTGGTRPPSPAIFCVWHNRLALSLSIYDRFVRRGQPARQLAAMVSASKDGGLLAQVLEHFGMQPVRGSSSRRGPQALLELTSWAERGYDLAITPDGPRGPCYVVQEGVVALAQLTSLPIVPVAYRLSWKIRLNTWDRFQIPMPFSKCEIAVGQSLHVPRDASDADRAALRSELEKQMQRMTRD